MDIEDLRAAMTVVSFASFLAIVAWAYGRGRKARFSEAEQLPFADEPGVLPQAPGRAVARRAEESGR